MKSSQVCSSANDIGSFDDSSRQHSLSRGWDFATQSTLPSGIFLDLLFDVDVLTRVFRRKFTKHSQLSPIWWNVLTCMKNCLLVKPCRVSSLTWTKNPYKNTGWIFLPEDSCSKYVIPRLVSSILGGLAISNGIAQDQKFVLEAHSASHIKDTLKTVVTSVTHPNRQ